MDVNKFNPEDNKVIEQLFLDIPICDVLTSRPGFQLEEPWVSMYVDSIREGRFGDAIWARYHMFGDVVDGMSYGGDKTVLEEIKEDALGYRVGDTEEYFEAMAFYARTSALDGRRDVIDMLMNLEEKDIAETRARVEAEREREEEEEEEEGCGPCSSMKALLCPSSWRRATSKH